MLGTPDAGDLVQPQQPDQVQDVIGVGLDPVSGWTLQSGRRDHLTWFRAQPSPAHLTSDPVDRTRHDRAACTSRPTLVRS